MSTAAIHPRIAFDAQFGLQPLAGVDEVGRGPWAGPVVAAAVIWPSPHELPVAFVEQIRDSKKVSASEREKVAAMIRAQACVSIAQASVAEIDAHNIRQATFLAMQRAVDGLSIHPRLILVDGRDILPHAQSPCRAIISGDQLSLSIAAASIVAKVHRDALMAQLAQEYPGYGWATNAGYGTPEHQAALILHGVTDHHRRSFAPIRALLHRAAPESAVRVA